MSVSFQYTTNDYIQAAKFHTRQSLMRNKALWIILVVAVILLLLCHMWACQMLNLLIGATVGGVLGGFLSYLLVPFIVRHQIKQNPKVFQSEAVITLTDSAISITSLSGTSQLAWENLYAWRKNDHYVLLYTTSRFYHIIPIRLAEKGLDIKKLTTCLTQQVGKPF